MNTDIENKKMLQSLKSAVAEALEKKRLLGQYAVIWKNNRPAIISNNDEAAVSVLAVHKTED
jgi:hypothetical protein